MELAHQVLQGHFGPVNLLQVYKNDDEKPSTILSLLKLLLAVLNDFWSIKLKVLCKIIIFFKRKAHYFRFLQSNRANGLKCMEIAHRVLHGHFEALY